MASHSGHRHDHTNVPSDDLPSACRTMWVLLRKHRAWKPADVDAVVECLKRIRRTAHSHPEDEFTLSESSADMLIGGLKPVFPHLAREVNSLDFHGHTSGGVSVDQLQACLKAVRSAIDAAGYVGATFDSRLPIFHRVLKETLVPTMEFAHSILTQSDAVSRFAGLRSEVVFLLHRLFTITDGEKSDRVVTRVYSSCVDVVTRTLEAIDREADIFDYLAFIAYCCVTDHERMRTALEPMSSDIQSMMSALMRGAMRTNYTPSVYCQSAEKRKSGECFVEAVGCWARYHARARNSGWFMNVDHFACFPLLLTWCTDPVVFSLRPSSCLYILYLFTAHFCTATHSIGEMLPGEAMLVLEFLISCLEDDLRKPIHMEAMSVLQTLLHDCIPHTTEFLRALDSPALVGPISDTLANRATTDAWALVLLRLSPDLLERCLSTGAFSAQTVLDASLRLRSDPYYNDDHDANTRYDIGLIHFALLATASYETLDYSTLHENATSILDALNITAEVTPSPRRLCQATEIISFLDAHPDESVKMRIRWVVAEMMRQMFLRDMPMAPNTKPTDGGWHSEAFPWSWEGWELRRRISNLVVVTHFASDHEVAQASGGTALAFDQVKNMAALWWFVFAVYAPLVSDLTFINLKTHAAYFGILEHRFFASAVAGGPQSTQTLARTALLLVTGAMDMLRHQDVTPASEECVYLAIWAYCSLYLPDAAISDELKTALIAASHYCREVNKRPMRDNTFDMRTREAAANGLRLLRAFVEKHQHAPSVEPTVT